MDERSSFSVTAGCYTSADSTPSVALWNRARAVYRACESRAMRAPLMCSMLAVFALLAISVVVFQPSYDTNDDVFMTMIAAGRGFCGAPDEHLVFTNIIIGRGLKHLYTLWPDVPWYGGYLLAVHYVAQLAVCYCVLATRSRRAIVPVPPARALSRRHSFRRQLGLYVTYFVIVELVFLNNLQFTSTAFLAAQAGLFLLWRIARLRAEEQPNAEVASLCAAVGLIVVAGMIRLEGVLMALVVAAPLAICLARYVSPRAWFPSARAAVFAAMLVAASAAYNRFEYKHDPRWGGFYAYNQLRCKFNDYRWTSYTPESAAAFSAAGWTENDHEMIANWFFDDPDLYSEAKLRSVLEAHPWKTARLTAEYFGQAARKLLQDRSVWAALLVLPFFLTSIDRGRNARRAILSCGIVAVASVLLLLLNNKLPPMRTYFPLLSFPVAAALLFAGNAGSFVKRPHSTVKWPETKRGGVRDLFVAWNVHSPWVRAAVVMLAVGVVMGTYRQGRRSMRVYRERAELQTFLDEAPSRGNLLYVCWEAAMPFELVSPLDSLRAWSPLSLVSLTWTQRTPWQEEMKRRFGVSSLAQALCERDDVVLIATPRHRSLFATFAKQHFSEDIEFVESNRVGQKFIAGHFQRRPRLGETAGRNSAAQAR